MVKGWVCFGMQGTNSSTSNVTTALELFSNCFMGMYDELTKSENILELNKKNGRIKPL